MENQLINLSINLFSVLFQNQVLVSASVFQNSLFKAGRPPPPPVLDLQYFEIYFVSIKPSAFWSTLASCPFWLTNDQYYCWCSFIDGGHTVA
jgi:hypothetical protein